MPSRPWTFLNAIGYFYNATAHRPDGELSNVDFEEMVKYVAGWAQGAREVEVRKASYDSLGWFKEDSLSKSVEAVIVGLSAILNAEFDEKQKQAFLNDLARIAITNKTLNEARRVWIRKVAKALKVDLII